MARNGRLAIAASIAAVVLAGSGTGVWALTQSGDRHGPGVSRPSPGYGYGHMGPNASGMMGSGPGSGSWMMGGTPYWSAGNGRQVTSLAAAKARAQRFADGLGLRAGEVMRFSRNYYVELTTSDGHGATEVLVDPHDGAVQLEYGPAMMWNTAYGMHRTATGAHARVSAAEARRIARQWLSDHARGQSPGSAEVFPGYYTMHTLDHGRITGMLSVNSSTGRVWYHSWHGTFEEMSDD